MIEDKIIIIRIVYRFIYLFICFWNKIEGRTGETEGRHFLYPSFIPKMVGRGRPEH